MTGTAAHADAAAGPSRVRMRHGNQAPPRPGTTIVNTRLRAARLSARAITAHRPGPGAAGPAAGAAGPAAVRRLAGRRAHDATVSRASGAASPTSPSA